MLSLAGEVARPIRPVRELAIMPVTSFPVHGYLSLSHLPVGGMGWCESSPHFRVSTVRPSADFRTVHPGPCGSAPAALNSRVPAHPVFATTDAVLPGSASVFLLTGKVVCEGQYPFVFSQPGREWAEWADCFWRIVSVSLWLSWFLHSSWPSTPHNVLLAV